ncbi:hypothetical protein [Pectinatus haikarae]|uniref:hypothetical protein n=1 Tax=Pectinatus haikarae TaxID=349096 RepID=UPI0018C5DC6B|nr:hypothetical protein [Pectinatus haikarae]
MELQIEYDDMAVPYLKDLVANNPKWIASALKSAAYQSQKLIKSGIQSGAPGGESYTPLMPDKLRKALEMVLGGNIKSHYQTMGRLKQAVGYDKTRADEGVVTVGWLSGSAVNLGSKQQEGFTTEVTDNVRRAFAAAGIKLAKGKTELTIAARPTFPPILPDVNVTAMQTVQAKLVSYICGNNARSTASSDRIYKVYR